MTRKFKLKPPEARASKRIFIRVTQANRAEIERRAELHNITVSKYMLQTALGRPIRSNNVYKIVLELMALTNLIREAYKSDRRNEHKYQEILQVVVDAITAIPLRVVS